MKKQNIIRRPAIGTGLLLIILLVITLLFDSGVDGNGWHWTLSDFIVIGVLLFGAGLVYEFLAGKVRTTRQRVVLGIVIIIAVLLIWVNLATEFMYRTITGFVQ